MRKSKFRHDLSFESVRYFSEGEHFQSIKATCVTMTIPCLGAKSSRDQGVIATVTTSTHHLTYRSSVVSH